MRQEVGTGDVTPAQAAQVPGGLLAVDQGKAVGGQQVHQCGEGALGGVGPAGEHGLAKEHAADGDAIEAGNELAVFTDLQGVGQPSLVQRRVGSLDGGGDPGAVLAGTGLCAGSHHVGKGRVERDLPPGWGRGCSGVLR